MDHRVGRRTYDGRLFEPGRRANGIDSDGVKYPDRIANPNADLGFLR
jgi:hypothetical protein